SRAREQARAEGVLADAQQIVRHRLVSSRGWGCGGGGAAADEVDDLHAIALRQAVLVVQGAADDALVDLHGHPGADDAERVQELADGDRVGDLAPLAVQPDLHRGSCACWGRGGPIAGFGPPRNQAAGLRARSCTTAARPVCRIPSVTSRSISTRWRISRSEKSSRRRSAE